MKKITVILIAALLICLLAACGASGDGNYIGKDAALDIACDHFQITDSHRASDSFANDKVKLVEGASTPYYLVSFDFGLYMFEYKIDASTGEILNWDHEANPEYT